MFIRKPLVIIGETHGVASNPAVIDWVVRVVNAHSILLELEKKWTSYLKNIASKKSAHSFVRALAKEQWIVQSGLIGKEHLPFLLRWSKEKRNIVGIKVEHPAWNDAERLTAQEIRRNLNVLKRNRQNIAVVGNLHARTKPFRLFSAGEGVRRYIPLGYLLRDVAVSIRVVYCGGTCMNFGFKKIQKHRLIHVNQEGAYVIRKSRSSYFDYDIFVGRAVPMKPLL
ncbi:MAG: hypothetical protein KBC26_02125 [Candidatus Pacebacteria bacterium]|nr:hypothetical protein [Candidatus Paceibacterota bacterium]